MRVLLDENLPHRLRLAISGHQVETASYNGWSGLKNGDLLKVAESSGVEVLVTADQSLTYQQSMAGRVIAVVVLSAQDFTILRSFLPEIQAAIERSRPGSYEVVVCGTSRRV